MEIKPQSCTLSSGYQSFLIAISFLIVALGQPAWCWWCGLISATVGYALFWRVLVGMEKLSHRLLLAFGWAFAIQIVHTSWLLSHPFWYIYAVWLFFSALWAFQLGIVSLLITPERIVKKRYLIGIASIWTMMEWMRLFFMSGYTWNPSGIALTSHIYPLQMASLGGIYAMSFWVIFVNLLLLRAMLMWNVEKNKYLPITIWAIAAMSPYIYGYTHFSSHALAFDKEQATNPKHLAVILVQPAFPPEEGLINHSPQAAVKHVMDEWRQILKIVSKQKGEQVDLVVLPEFTVPFGTYTPIFPLEPMRNAFVEFFGLESLSYLPPLDDPWATIIETSKGKLWVVSNAFMTQALSNLFHAEVVIGLEDVEEIAPKKMAFYSAALCFHPHDSQIEERYEKRVLVPMAEYIPFEWCKELARSYGITDSFTPGKQAKIFTASRSKVNFGTCICYEETFGHLIRENRQLGAQALVNLTSDVWYPNSRLPWQHFDHARLRTVENGIPLIRACNTGVTCVIDSLGRIVSVLKDSKGNTEWISDSILIQVPLYSYQTLYAGLGDTPIIGFSVIVLLIWALSSVYPKKIKKS